MADYKINEIAAVLRANEARRQKALKASLVEAAHLGLEAVIERVPMDTKELARSGHVIIRSDGAEIMFDAPHAAAVDQGTRPHWAPLQPLVEWVRRHLNLFDIGAPPKLSNVRKASTKTILRFKARYADYEDSINKIARGIQAKIAREGSEPTHFLSGATKMLAAIKAAVIRKNLAR